MSQGRIILGICLVLSVFILPNSIFKGCSGNGNDEGGVSMLKLAPDTVDCWSRLGDSVSYDRETIYDYIDGAGEVYLSYAFRQVGVFRYQCDGQPDLVLEIFDMGSSADAFGIFSYSRESETEGIGQAYDFRGNLLCFWQGRYYICILIEGQSQRAREVVSRLAQEVDSRLPQSGELPEIFTALPSPGLKPGTVRYFHIFPTLNYHYFLAERDILNLNTETEAVLAAYQPGSTRLLAIKYPSEEAAAAARESFTKYYLPDSDGAETVMIDEGQWVSVENVGADLVIVLEAPGRNEAENLVARYVQNLKATETGGGKTD